jgi:hypothetical protein
LLARSYPEIGRRQPNLGEAESELHVRGKAELLGMEEKQHRQGQKLKGRKQAEFTADSE